jgi:hypothetical protein
MLFHLSDLLQLTNRKQPNFNVFWQGVYDSLTSEAQKYNKYENV